MARLFSDFHRFISNSDGKVSTPVAVASVLVALAIAGLAAWGGYSYAERQANIDKLEEQIDAAQARGEDTQADADDATEGEGQSNAQSDGDSAQQQTAADKTATGTAGSGAKTAVDWRIGSWSGSLSSTTGGISKCLAASNVPLSVNIESIDAKKARAQVTALWHGHALNNSKKDAAKTNGDKTLANKRVTGSYDGEFTFTIDAQKNGGYCIVRVKPDAASKTMTADVESYYGASDPVEVDSFVLKKK